MVNIWPIDTFWKRLSTARFAARLLIDFQGLYARATELQKSRFLESTKKPAAELLKRIEKLCEECRKATSDNRRGRYFDCSSLLRRRKQVTIELDTLAAFDLNARRFVEHATSTMHRAQRLAGPFHARLHADLNHRANMLRDTCFKMQRAKSTADVHKGRKDARLFLNQVKRSVLNALKAERNSSVVDNMLSEASALGEPVTQLWRESLESLGASSAHFAVAYDAGLYEEAARRHLRECRRLMKRIGEERSFEQRRAVESIYSWDAILGPHSTRREDLRRLRSETPECIDLGGWYPLRRELGVEAAQHYAEALRINQDWVRQDMKLKHPPIRSIDLNASPSAPILRMNELQNFARLVRDQMRRGGAVEMK